MTEQMAMAAPLNSHRQNLLLYTFSVKICEGSADKQQSLQQHEICCVESDIR